MEALAVEGRTEGEILEAKPAVVTLGGREYEISPKKGRKHTRALRAKLGALMPDTDAIAQLAKDVTSSETVALGGDAVDKLAPMIMKCIGPAFDEMLDIVYDYEPTIAADRDWLEENADDAEFIKALVAIFGLTYGPFVAALGLNMTTGAEKTPQAGSN